MEWAEIDALLWLFLALQLIRFGVKSLFAWGKASGFIPDTVADGIQAVLV